jgi:hypothetical protein
VYIYEQKGNPIHVQVNARKEEDVDDAQIRQRLITAVGSNYEAGAVKQVLNLCNFFEMLFLVNRLFLIFFGLRVLIISSDVKIGSQ